MKVKDLVEYLLQHDAELEVKVRISDPGDLLVEEGGPDGSYLTITNQMSVLEENGHVVVIGDGPPEEDEN